MRSYTELIFYQIEGDLPREKYENLSKMQDLLQKIAYPRRGCEEENWSIKEMAQRASCLINLDTDYIKE